MPRRSIGGYLIGTAFIAVLAQIYNNSSKKSGAQTAQQKSGETKSNSLPIKLQSANEGWHSEERAHHGKERVFWKWTLVFYGLTFVATAAAAYFAYSAFVQAKRQADISQRALTASDRPFIYFSLNNVSDDNAASPDFTITNVSDRPAIVTYVEIWNNDSEVPILANRPFLSCFVNLGKIALAIGKELSRQCPYNGHDSVTNTHHLYGVIVYSSVTGKRWRQKFDYFYNPVFKTWNYGGNPTMNREVMIDARGDEIRDEAN